MTVTVGRRAVLKGSAATVAVLVSGGAVVAGLLAACSDADNGEANGTGAPGSTTRSTSAPPIAPRQGLDGIAAVGQRYLELTPDEADVETLSGLLPDVDPSAPVEEQLASLDGAIRRDFAAGDAVLVDGWLLARTEARAAALVALTR